MYGALSDFLRDLSTESPALWALLVLGVMLTLSLGLHTLWESLLRLVLGSVSRPRRRN